MMLYTMALVGRQVHGDMPFVFRDGLQYLFFNYRRENEAVVRLKMQPNIVRGRCIILQDHFTYHMPAGGSWCMRAHKTCLVAELHTRKFFDLAGKRRDVIKIVE